MSSLGTFVLLAAFVVGAYAVTVSVVGARRRSTRLVESGIGAFYLITALLLLASAIIVHAFVSDDFSIKYVNLNSDTVQPLFYKLTAFWGGLDGSILFWVALLSVFGAIAVRVNRESYRELIPYVVAIIAVVEMFFIFIMVIHNNPFARFLLEAPTQGRGMEPLLQTPLMVIHPPSLYTGFVGMTIPYAFGMAALITGHLDDSWLRAVRRWTMIGWLFLSFGLILGMIWAYEELGWGGYWGWDPVENAGLLPWFTATAFLHSVMVQERRGMLRVWNVTLVILTFLLTLFATFMTRTGIVQSVHAFGEDPQLATMFSVFMISLGVVSFGYVFYRLPLLRARHELDSWISREAAFLVNNWILLFSAMFILFGTMFPTLSEAVRNERLTVGPAFYNKWMLPIGLALLLLTGIGPLLAWRKSTLTNLRDSFLWPVLFSIVVAGSLVALGVRVWTSGLCFALCAFVLGTITQEFIRGALVRQDATGTDVATALIGLVARSRRRYGGYIVHVGIVLIFLGFAGEGFKQEEQLVMKQGQSMTIGSFSVRQDAIRVSDDGQKQMVTSFMTISRNGHVVGEMHPAKWFFRKHEETPTTEVAIRRGFAEDLYIVLAGYDVATQAATLHIVVNPLVNWIWLGFGIMAFGTIIALLPERAFAFAAARVPPGAATTTTLLIAMLLAPMTARHAHAQHQEGVADAYKPAMSEHERAMREEIICTCGTCGRRRLAECTCPIAVKMQDELKAFIDQGKNREDIRLGFVALYGSQEPLSAPIDEGFNRLAWAVPYLLGGMGFVTAVVVARRWSKSSSRLAVAGGAPSASIVDARLEERLSDELRDLD